MKNSTIEWTEVTWNPTTGCDKISAGCKFCYAEVMAKRLQKMGVSKYQNGFKLTIHDSELQKPYKMKKSKVVFVDSMSDLFHKDVPISFIHKVFKVMRDNSHHIFQILTKRADLLLQYDKEGLLDWADNIWMGVSVEDDDASKRIDFLRQTKAKIKFLSCEPLISDLPDINLTNIDWVIVGGESGRTPRKIEKQWILNIKERCDESNVAFFFKQWGGTNKKKSGRQLEGELYNSMPIV